MNVNYGVCTVHKVNDAYWENLSLIFEKRDIRDEFNLETKRFFYMLGAAGIVQKCRGGYSPLSSANRYMAIKVIYNLVE